MAKRSKIVIRSLVARGMQPRHHQQWWWRLDAHWFDGGNKRTLTVHGPSNYRSKVAAQIDMELCVTALQDSGVKP